MYSKMNKKFMTVLLSGSMLCSALLPSMEVRAEYINTTRDTALPEEAIEIVEQSVDEYEKLYETDSAIYYFRDDRDIIAVYDKEMGYLWKTGIDSASEKEMKRVARDAETEEDFELLENTPVEDNMNQIFTDMANALITVEYRDPNSVESIKKISSCSEDAKSTLSKISDNEYCLDVDLKEIDLELKVYITFGEKEISYNIKYEDMKGDGLYSINNLYLTPFLGSSGGKTLSYNRDTGEYDILKDKDAPSGYAFVPDGSGALIRFRDNNMSFQEYVGDVYGKDASQGEYYYEYLTDAIPLKDPVMPVFGVAYGDDQVAFVAYADEGAEFMNVVCTPEENVTYYTWTAARFVYNLKYHQVYNKAGAGYFAIMEEPNKFDISMTYEFLSGDGSGSTPAANYVGMALAYREHLLENGTLAIKENASSEIPLRLDFIMADAKSSIVGTETVITTTAEDVEEILSDVTEKGVTNINTGLYGWQKKGITFAKPYTQKFSSAIGKKGDFKDLIADFSEQGIDVSLAQDYVTINKDMLSYYNTAVRHVNSWYAFIDKGALLPENAPLDRFGFARPEKSADWLLKQYDKQSDYASSMTIEGIGSVLTGDYSNEDEIFYATDAVNLYRETMEQLAADMTINMENPGVYMWQYTDRYLQAPVGHSQYVFETDAVPFLQMVLNGTMEVYAPYANFSFYTQSDILKMIDYNLSPSFILSKEPSYLLADTVSSDLYSTEYTLYEELIQELYSQINGILSQVSTFAWVNRTVYEDGVIINTYEKDGQTKEIVINYTSDAVTYNGTEVPALTAQVIQ